ncbi:hypothetical protein FRUB_06867 [Fimbriiglobus ruber]|uniref:Uncharacterized protein n=1 Tax=Fimbriiglobus ruber TaxID=1908690 RepID=A0A225DNJ3_9BACT|nr:hypothetical protein FRUB_06867 [Fimbriiglobus ruber]
MADFVVNDRGRAEISLNTTRIMIEELMTVKHRPDLLRKFIRQTRLPRAGFLCGISTPCVPR